MRTGKEFAECALNPKWDKYTYSHLDCQGFVEAVLKDIGIRKNDGSVFDWRGSNSMYRNYQSWTGTIEECYKAFGCIPVGAFVYMWEPTGEKQVGYTDGLGNFKHVGIYCGNDCVRDSTRVKNGRDGVGKRSLKGFTHVSLFSFLDYTEAGNYNSSEILSIINKIEDDLTKLKKLVGG